MSYRMACAIGDRIAAIASLAGADFAGEMDCVPPAPVSVLQIHGTLDDTIAYDGLPSAYPSARATVIRWAGRAGCDTTMPTVLPPLDLESALTGSETTVEQWSTGCMPGLDAELWTIEDGGHIPPLTAQWMPTLAGWLLRHQR
jgi:polyhydroxybutyrate depolymerase